MNLVREIPALRTHACDLPEIGSAAGTFRGILAKLAAWLDLSPADLKRVGVDMEFGAALLLVPADLVSPERFNLLHATGHDEDAVNAIFGASPAWVSLTIARVPAAEFLEASAVWRLGSSEALLARWPRSVVG